MSDSCKRIKEAARSCRLALVQEHIEEQQKLFGQFCDPRHEEEAYYSEEAVCKG